ncbi:hypothetical protein VB779_08805 [Haloarculaceae archaeon H-GB11]|nr:hypothetical protein [Haloarculaceae archaeon H-GB11]
MRDVIDRAADRLRRERNDTRPEKLVAHDITAGRVVVCPDGDWDEIEGIAGKGVSNGEWVAVKRRALVDVQEVR